MLTWLAPPRSATRTAASTMRSWFSAGRRAISRVLSEQPCGLTTVRLSSYPQAYGCKGEAMQAAVVDRYGAPEVVRVAEVPRPSPRAGEVLVQVRAVAVTSAEARIRAARFP